MAGTTEKELIYECDHETVHNEVAIPEMNWDLGNSVFADGWSAVVDLEEAWAGLSAVVGAGVGIVTMDLQLQWLGRGEHGMVEAEGIDGMQCGGVGEQVECLTDSAFEGDEGALVGVG